MAAAVISDAGNGSRDRKSALPLALPLRYSRVLWYAVRNLSYLWTRGLCSATLARLWRALWSQKMQKVVPHKYPRRRLMLQTLLPASRLTGVQWR